MKKVFCKKIEYGDEQDVCNWINDYFNNVGEIISICPNANLKSWVIFYTVDNGY